MTLSISAFHCWKIAASAAMGAALAAGYGACCWFLSSSNDSRMQQEPRTYSVEQRLAEFGEAASRRMRPHFDAVGISFPPAEVSFVAVKDTRILHIYARSDSTWQLIRSYPILAASGRLGPKLRRGDEQVPEGIYRVSLLNPNSRFHVSLRLNYPNRFDQKMATRDGRTDLGGDIMIHGNAVSVGCLAMGDEAAEDLFYLAALTRPNPIKVIITPTDFRQKVELAPIRPAWTAELYHQLRIELRRLPKPIAP